MSERVLVIDLHLQDPAFAGPRWFPEGVIQEVCRVTKGATLPEPDGWSHVVVSGSATSILDEPAWLPDVEAFLREVGSRRTSIMGVCYGCQLVARTFYGRRHVRVNPRGVEVGWLPVEVSDEAGAWFEGLPRPFTTWHFHYDEVCDLPAGCRVLARTPGCAIQAFDDPERRLFAVQFHPEMDEDEGNHHLRAEEEKLASHGIGLDDLIASTRDDGARLLFARFLGKEWEPWP